MSSQTVVHIRLCLLDLLTKGPTRPPTEHTALAGNMTSYQSLSNQILGSRVVNSDKCKDARPSLDSKPEFKAWIQSLDSKPGFKAWIQSLHSKPAFKACIQSLHLSRQLCSQGERELTTGSQTGHNASLCRHDYRLQTTMHHSVVMTTDSP